MKSAARLFAPVLMFAPLLAGCHGAAKPAEEESSQAPVHAQPAAKMAIGEWTELYGATQPLPNRSARISAILEGHVVSVLGDGKGATVVEGQRVKPGQVIVRLDDRVQRANAAKLQETIKDLDEQQRQATYALELATIDVTRLKELQRGTPNGSLPSVSQIEIDKAAVLHKDAQSKVAAVAARRSAVVADLKGVEEHIEFLTLRAPIVGRLGMVNAALGQTLTPGTVIADVVDLDEIDALCFAPPDAAAKIAVDQPAKLLPNDGSGEKTPLPGKVAFVGVQAQPETGNVPIKVRFANPGERLRSNAVVRVSILTQPEKERLTIPDAAIVSDRDVPSVVAVEHVKTEKKGSGDVTTGKARLLDVVLGVRDRGSRVVELLELRDPATKELVAATDLYFVTAGGNGLRNDDTVRIESPHK